MESVAGFGGLRRWRQSFDEFFRSNMGRVCLDSMASKEVHTVIVREIKNMIANAKLKAAGAVLFVSRRTHWTLIGLVSY